MATYKTLVLDVETIQGGSLAGAIVYVSYDRTVRLISGGIVPDPAGAGVATPVTGTTSVQVIASDDPDLTTDSAGFGINVRVVWTEAPSWRQQSKSYTAQVLTSQPANVNLSNAIGALPAPAYIVNPLEVFGLASDAKTAAQSAQSSAGASASAAAASQTSAASAQSSATASASSASASAASSAASAALVGAPAGSAIDAHLGGDSTGLVTSVAGKVAKGDERINVKTQFGAIADWNGTAGSDNTTPLANAVSAAESSSREVFLPAGSYYAATLPAIPDGVTLRGSSTAPTILVFTGNANGITAASGASNITIERITVKRTGTSATTTAANIILTGGSGHRILHCASDGGKSGLILNEATNCVVDDFIVTNLNGTNKAAGVLLTGVATACTGCRVRNVKASNIVNGLGVFANYESNDFDVDIDLVIEGCTVDGSGDNGIRVQTKNGRQQGNYVIRDCTVRNPAINGIRINGYGASVVNNTVRGGTAGIRDGGGVGGTWVERSIIQGNHLYGASLAGAGIQLQVGSRNCSVIGNHAEGWSYGIYIGDTNGGAGPASGHVVSVNETIGNGRHGIFFSGGNANMTVTGNVSKNNGQYTSAQAGVFLDAGSVNFTVTGNRAFDDNVPKKQTYGLLMAAAAPLAQPSVSLSTATTGGSLAAATWYYQVTALNANGETPAPAQVSIATTGSTSTVTVTWSAIMGATGYNIYRSGASLSGTERFLANVGAVTSYVDSGGATTASMPPPTTDTSSTNLCVVNGNNWGGNNLASVYSGPNTVHANNIDGP